jgi:hypothetical protein
MAKAIYKYPLINRRSDIDMPLGAQVLAVQAQFETPTLWALVDPEQQQTELRTFRIIGTGHEIVGDPGLYRGTVQIGPLVWHVFEVGHD